MTMEQIADSVAAALTVLVPLLAAFAGWAAGKLGKSRKEDKALTEGVKSLLRGQIIDDGLTYLEEGAIPPFALETMEHQNDAYVRLGDGDKSINDIVDRCRRLPIRSGHEHE